MKKFFAIVLALALVCSLGITAFAAGSPTGAAPTEEIAANAAKAGGFSVCDAESDAVVDEIPADEVTMVDVDDADSLEDADKEAFLAAYEAAKAIEGKVVADFFWFDVPEQFLKENTYIKFPFECEGANPQVQVNGKDMEVVAEDAPNAYFAKLTEVGAVAILCDAE